MEELNENQGRSDYGRQEGADSSSTGTGFEGRKLRPRKKVTASEEGGYGERRGYPSREGYGNRGGYPSRDGYHSRGGYSPRGRYGEGSNDHYNRSGEHYGHPSNDSYGSQERSGSGERHSFREGGSYGQRDYGRGGYGQRPSYGRSYDRGNSPYGERRNYDRHTAYSAPSEGGEEHTESRGAENRGNQWGERRDRRSYGSGGYSDHRGGYGQKPSYGNRSEHPDHRSYGHRDTQDGERREGGYDNRRSYSKGNDRRGGYGQRPSYGGGERKGGYGRKPYGQKPYGKNNEYQFSDNNETVNQMMSAQPQDFSGAGSELAQAPFKEEIRLNKFIANSGVCSRREADDFIQAGVVTVNGEVVSELGAKVNVLKDDIRFNGERLKGEEKIYIVMNKPKGFVTTASDPHADRTVMDLLKGCTSRVFPVGRLDKNTTGVLMFTNDGDIAEKLTHPSYDKKKIYQVILDHDLSEEDRQKILGGIELNDGIIAADELEYIDETDHRKLGIKIHSGKNRIVRRIFESLSYDVRALDRVYFAGLTKKGLQKGEWRYLTQAEVSILKMGAYM